MNEKPSVSRRDALKALGAVGALGLAGCTDDSDSTATATESQYPSVEEGAEEWGQRLNDHAEEADIEWDQFEDENITLTFGMGLHPYSTVTQEVIPWFEDLTGIEVEYEIFPEDQYWLEARNDLAEDREYDGMMTGLWQAAEFHENGWVRDLNEFIQDPSLTDQEWLAMEDFLPETIELMSFPAGEDSDDPVPGNEVVDDLQLTGFPNGIEAYGAIGCDRPTFEAVDGVADDPADEITSFQALRDAAQIISESDAVAEGDTTTREGITSRTSTTTLSSANFATMFKTHGGDWIDRDAKEAVLHQSEEGRQALELFGEMVRDYGPEDPGQKNWYRANNALSIEETAMIYTTPSTSGAITEAQIERTHWVPPLPAPDGGDPEVATWVWATGISQFSDNPGAAWLYIQWANSRVGNYMLSTKQWEGHDPRAGTARINYIDQRFQEENGDLPGFTQSFFDAHIEGMNQVPIDPPAVPVDTPQNMPIMTEAAVAMNSVVRGQKTAQEALDDAAPQITEFASRIPDRYVE